MSCHHQQNLGGLFLNMYNNESVKPSEIKYVITMDQRKWRSKPNEEEKKTITRNLILHTGITINQFSQLVSAPSSHTWSGGLFKGFRSNNAWEKQSVFALDFDDGKISIDDVYARLKEIGIVPQTWYTTFSDSPELRKFRVVIFLDNPITDIKIHKLIHESLFSLFPEVDDVCKDASRYYFGGKNCTVVHTEPISSCALIDALTIQMYSTDSRSFRKIPLESSYYTGTKTAEKSTFLYNKYRNDQISAEIATPSPTSVQGGKKVKIDFDIARKRIMILNEFLNGTWLNHQQLFGLATNLIHIEGGFQLMTKTMEKFNNEGRTQYTQNNFNIMPYVNKVKYYPKQIYSFSPYKEDSDLYDIISTTRDVRGNIETLEPIQKIKINDAEDLLKMKYEEVINRGEIGKIYLFSLPTAIGKTECFTGTKAAIALPTHDLKNEIGRRMKTDYVKTPDPIGFDNESISLKLQYYYSIGLPKKAMGILYHIANPKNSDSYTSKEVGIANKHLSDLNESMNSSNAILTTHKRALFTEYGHDTLIFDEDPINSLLDIKKMEISDLYQLFLGSGKKEIKTICEYLETSAEGEIKITPTFSFDIDDLIDSISSTGLATNVFEFFASSFYIKTGSNTVYYVVRRNLPLNKKVIIMSATLPIYIYQKLFGNRVEIIDIRDVEQAGTITQHTKWSCSREGLKRYVGTISNEVGELPVITFNSFGKHFKNPVKDMYFGNCSGYDSLKGMDIAVVGTPHRNTIQYFLTAKVLGVDYKTTDTTMSHQKIEYNGFRFKFNCFDHEELREIQLSFIESDLIQAVGRARTLRTSAHVDLYSSFPLRISDEFRF
jgi:hypothetical protein